MNIPAVFTALAMGCAAVALTGSIPGVRRSMAAGYVEEGLTHDAAKKKVARLLRGYWIGAGICSALALLL